MTLTFGTGLAIGVLAAGVMMTAALALLMMLQTRLARRMEQGEDEKKEELFGYWRRVLDLHEQRNAQLSDIVLKLGRVAVAIRDNGSTMTSMGKREE